MSGLTFRQAASIIESESFFQCHRRNALMAENACSIGFRSGEYGGKNTSLRTENNECKNLVDEVITELTGFTFNKLSNSFSMVNIAVVDYDHTS